ncbi:cytidine deaminase [Tamlana fucoidanivorans]|uniref:Cytidine deaminase n=1 Tax=Allotamlana fucoidanivorans TaxID=2583814 RepID=A0A5C4SK76_9FLAO|nr:cytidine deaminase [Tamlana fucoidanivorans]TNJ43813.1 cytidine deaminase [Tamlana fucoidanivorans]
MKEIEVSSKLQVFESFDELSEEVKSLLEEAISVRKQAYAPYSNFLVGTALLLDNGEVITGSNQENASYPSGLCAERTAIYYAGSKFPEAQIVRMAISAGSKHSITSKPIPPCGACRQAIAEYEVKQSKPIEIYFMGETGTIARSHSLSNLLPFGFDKSVL